MKKLREEMLKITKRDFTIDVLREIQPEIDINKPKEELLDLWVTFVKNNPTKWKAPHTKHINKIFQDFDRFKQRILKQPYGKEKWDQLMNLIKKEP